MEKIIGVDQLRPRLGEYLEEIEKGDVIVITYRSAPKGVIMSYRQYEQLKKVQEKVKMMELKTMLEEVREKAANYEISEEEVLKEIEDVRKCGR
ncbi:type II toxin-antitoxin system Phd/YefM family antitoxin [Carboxydothermus ferrireducens]|uniref:Antitoxin n=1 Tax=Carboxydothermus ferrireducens DSM 11255 TaxID=1119529 RepID=A0ABX2R973_9THEO|nr:type II toxin-antitoxin system Phd/YefM family antitoxin [Carboxydothermus ferrireducens]NYE57723.1 prevent-host-death family protein [Carboxydothermus ferrireducens DSM 11255]